jgi:hypothetical protein
MGLSLGGNGSTSADRTPSGRKFAKLFAAFCFEYSRMCDAARQPLCFTIALQLRNKIERSHRFWTIRRYGDADLLCAGKAQPWFIFAFTLACAMASVYGFLQGAWPLARQKLYGQWWRSGAGGWRGRKNDFHLKSRLARQFTGCPIRMINGK